MFGRSKSKYHKIMGPPNKTEISIISKHTVKSSTIQDDPIPERRHLTPFDLASIKMKYIKYGLLYKKPASQTTASTIANLLASFSKTLNLFHPLAGRLATTHHHDDDTNTNTISISLDCTNQGAEFIHASAPTASIHHDLSDLYPLPHLIGIDGHDRPLLAVQVTELSDGVLIAWAINHVVADGASHWHFINTWSSLARSGNPEESESTPDLPVFKPWFISSRPPPIRLPENFIDPPRNDDDAPKARAAVENRIFDFSAESIAALKARANREAEGICSIEISSLQALLAHAWRAITRARALRPEDTTNAVVIVGYRNRKLEPAVPKRYFGNVANGVRIRASAKELEEEKLGSTAMSLNKAINSRGEEDVYRWVESWCDAPMIHDGDPEMDNIVLMGGSSRFDVYGNDFGWGEPVAARYCWGNMDRSGFVKVAPGKEEGSVHLDVVLREGAMRALLEDEEFMAMVG